MTADALQESGQRTEDLGFCLDGPESANAAEIDLRVPVGVINLYFNSSG